MNILLPCCYLFDICLRAISRGYLVPISSQISIANPHQCIYLYCLEFLLMTLWEEACVHVLTTFRVVSSRNPPPSPQTALTEACRCIRKAGLLKTHGVLQGETASPVPLRLAGEHLHGADSPFIAAEGARRTGETGWLRSATPPDDRQRTTGDPAKPRYAYCLK